MVGANDLIGVIVYSTYAEITYTPTSPLTAYIDPNGDVATGWDTTGTYHYTEIDEGTRQTNTPNLDDYISVTNVTNTFTDDYDMATLTNAGQVTAVKVWVHGGTYCGGAGDRANVYANIKIGDTWQSQQEIIPSFTSAQNWYSVTFSSLSMTQAQLDSLQVRIIGDIGFTEHTQAIVDAMYAEITYEEVVIPEYNTIVFVVVLVASVAIAFAVARKK